MLRKRRKKNGKEIKGRRRIDDWHGSASHCHATVCKGNTGTAKTGGTLNMAWPYIAQEGFLPDYGIRNKITPGPLCMITHSTKMKNSPVHSRASFTRRIFRRWPHLHPVPAEGRPLAGITEVGEVTAVDFKFSYEKIMRKGSTAQLQPNFSDTIKSIDVIDPYTVKIILRHHPRTSMSSSLKSMRQFFVRNTLRRLGMIRLGRSL